jgi:hypothetical protein
MKDEQERSEVRATRWIWGRWLDAHAWDHFVTATCRSERSSPELAREFVRGFVRRVAFDARRSIGWYAAIENGRGGRLHLHALLWGTGKVAAERLAEAWKAGICCAVPYNPHRGAAQYVTKGIDDRVVWWDVSRTWPPGR